jgi:hypothetical protein
LIVGADVIFKEELINPLLEGIYKISSENTVILIGYE